MSTIQLCLCALHTDVENNGSNLDVQAAQQHIIQINQYFKSDITSIESEVALQTLFVDDKGILSYAKAIINFDLINFKAIIADILFLFLQLIESFPTSIGYYIKSITCLCDLCSITVKKCAILSIKTYQIYKKILELNNFNDQIDINKIIEHLNNEVSLGDKISSTARQHIYNLFGIIGQHYPMYLKNYADKLLNLFCHELQIQIDTREKNLKKFSAPIAIGCLNGLTGLLNNFADHIETHDYNLRLYEILKKLIGTVEEKKRHVINRTGLKLFQKHVQLFLKFLFQDSAEITWFQIKLWNWCTLSNLEDKKIGLSSFEVLYKGASMEFTKNLKINEINTRNSLQKIIEIMILFLKSKLYENYLNFQEHAAVVRSIGWLSEPCYNILGEENLIEIFIILSLQAEEKFLNCSLKIKNYDPNAANYLNSLSLIIRNLKILNSDQISFMQRLSIYCFNDFITAQPKSEWQDNITDALIISMYCLASYHGNILDKYLKQLFYVGLIKSCSHRVASDAELVEEYTGHVLFKSTSYVPLWICLLKANQCHLFDLYLNIPIAVKSILEKSLMCCFMSSFLKIITKLDLFTNKSTNEFESETEFIARKPSDFTVLINLVQVYSEILYSLELDIETTILWLPCVLDTIINHSIKFPIVSSLYKILTVIFQEIDWCLVLENKNNSIKEKVLIYVNHIMVYVHVFKGDLQFCCLEMLMSLPSIVIKEIFNNQMIEIIKTALILGSTFLSLAKITVNALQRWQQDLSKDEIDQLLVYIMPYLDLLLRTKGYDSEVEVDNSILYQMKIQNHNKKTLIKQNKLIMKPESELENVQTQILKYLAQLDMTSCLRLLGDPNTTTSNPINIINYKLPFNDCKINISFDHLLPRILELCQYCSNRQIRFIACEIFHAYVILYLGNNLILERSKPTEMKIVTAKIIPVVIKLACDMDNLVQQLFEPLAIGIVHYFASGIQYNSIYTPIIIDILMDSTSDSSEAIKKFSAKCIMEFIHWTLKANNTHHKPSISLGIIIKKIEQFCIHSDPDKQLGAAITFNSCYSILREDEIVINELWIQLLYYFVLILDSTKSVHSEEHVLKAIDHLERVFMEKSNLFNEISKLRKTPNQFYGNQLFNVVEWLLKYIGSPVGNCRSKCFNMANLLSRKVKDHNSFKNVLESFILSHGENQLIKYIERDLNSFINLKNINTTSYDKYFNFESTLKILINWLNQLVAALDCYVSLFKENMINFKLLSSPGSSLFQSIHHFLFQIEEFSFIQWLNNMNIPFKKNEKEIIIQSRNFNTLKNHVIIGIFQFISVFDNNLLLDKINQDKINELAIKYIFEYNTDYSDEKSNLNCTAIVHYVRIMCCSSTFSNKLRQKLTEKWSNVVFNMNMISMISIQNNFISINQLLLNNNVISSMDLLCIVDRKCIMDVIFKYVYNNGVAVHFETLQQSYLENLLDFVVNLDYENDELIILIFNTIDILNINTNKNMAFGQYFFNLFSRPITKYFLKTPDMFVNKLFIEYPLNDLSLNVILEVLKTSSDEKTNGQGQLIIEKIVNNMKYWEQFQFHFSWNEIYDFVELSSNIMDTFRNENMICFQKWICENLINDSIIIYYKCKLLGLLPKLVSSEIFNKPIDNNIRKCLISFRNKYFSGASTNLRPLSLDFTNYVTAFQKILSAMELSSSNLLFEVVVEWCIKDFNHVCIKQVENTLYYFFKRLSDEKQYLCCQFVYGKFRNEIMSEGRRQMIINTFLIPIVSYCRKNVIIKLYSDIIDFILTTVNENLLANDSGKARQLLVSKIACFKLIEGMFKFFTFTELNNNIITCKLIESQSKNLIIQLRNSAVKVRYSNVNYRDGSKEIQELLRQLHCFSYNALITIIINTENDHKKYTIFLFNEHPPKQFIWRNLVDCSIHHEFPIDFDTIPQRKKKLINIRTKCNQNFPEVYIDLTSHLKNTLVEDLENYDYNNSYLRSNIEDCSSPNSQSLNQMFSVELEMDNFNNHECMAHLCAVIKSLTSESTLSTIKPIMDMPDWMRCLKLTFCDKSSDTINSKILLLKLIINCETYFEPYAKHWLGPIMQFILDKHLGNNLNYFLADVVSMLVSWHNIAVPSTEDEKYLAKNLLCFLLTVSHSEIKNVFKHNMELVKFIVENWKCSLAMEFDVLLSLLKPNQINKSLECGLHLIGIVTANGILPFNELSTKIFMGSLIENLKSNNQIISILSSEILGMLLNIFIDNAMDEIELLQFLSSVLTFSENIDITKVLSCLYHVHKHYSKILDSFVDDLFNIFEKLHGIHRTQCLEMILNRLSKIDNPYEKIKKLKSFFNMLNNNGSDDQLLCFKMVLQLIPFLHAEDVLVLIKMIADNSYLHSNDHRKLVYDIMCCTYEIYIRNNSEISNQILEKCKKTLLNGLMDNDDELRQQLFRFWADDKKLPLKCIDRLLILLDQLYSPDIELHFLGNLVSILLESCSTAVDFDEKIFQYPLHACEFEDYKLTVSWRAKNLATVPKYADTIASQLNRSNTLGCYEADIHQRFQIKKTLSFQFEPTLVQTQLTNSISAVKSYSQMSINKADISTLNSIDEQNWNQNFDIPFATKSDFIQQQKIRLLRDKSKLSKHFAMKNMQMNFKREIFKKERNQKRESSVITYRNYRIGDFPDIEITNASVIKPMIELAKRDNNIARIILSSIMYEFKNNPKIDQQYFESLNKSLTNMINHSHSSNPSLVGFILDTAYYYPTQINLDPIKIKEVATSCGLMSLGALILETSINNSLSNEIYVHIAKKSKITHNVSDDIWIKLAEIYKNMGELDVVESIIQDKMNNLSCDLLKEALKAEQSDDWRTAQIKFKSVLEFNESDTFLENDKNFLFEEYYKCSEYLSDWKDINKMLKSQIGENYEKIWDNNWYKEHLLSRILHSELHEILTGESDGKFIETFSNWLNDRSKEEYILTHVAAQACLIFLCCDDLNKTQLWCKLRMHNFLKEWENISPQYYKLRADRLFNLQTISEIYDFTSCSIQTYDNTNAIKRQIQTWQSKMPTDSDSLLAWDIKMLNRSFIFNKIKATMDELPSEGKSNLKQVLNKHEVELMLALIESAINKNNFYVAKKYMNEYRFDNIESWKSDFILCRSKILAMSSNYTIDIEKKLQYYLKSWSELDDIIKEQCSSNCLLKMHIHIANISKNMINTLHDVSDINLLSSNFKFEVMNKLKRNLQFGNINEVVQQIDGIVVENLKSALHIALNYSLCTKTIINTYLILAQYCLERLNQKENNEVNKKKELFIESVLKAMNYNSKKASELFPIILQFENLSDSKLKETFLIESQNVPEHMFLQWINQILGCLDSPVINVIGPLLIRVSKVYPKSVQLPLKIYMEKDVFNNAECELFLKTELLPLISDIHIDMFIKAISNICCPLTQLSKYINDVLECIKTNCFNKVILAYENMLNKCFITEENLKFKGKEFKTLDIFKDKLKVILDIYRSSTIDINDSYKALQTIKKQLNSYKEEIYSKKRSTNLTHYSPWLAQYSHHIDTLEVPGQYSGVKKPNPDNHIIITSFKPYVQVMHSKRNPVKITMIGNDGKKYNFLVKFGEDLRQDQRVEQLLQVMNNTLFENAYCCERLLSLFTYTVHPISKMLGLIEWINNTVTLKDFICESFSNGKENGIKQLHSKIVEHSSWLSEKSISPNMLDIYKQATIEYNSIVTTAKFKQLVQSIPENILRKSLLNMCHCPEMYIHLRSKFITSYSVLSVCHWLLGIGDRHLNNTIVSIKTGCCIGIDFDFAFHTATSVQVIPELIPFRMSPHIVSLMAPLNLTGFIRETMVHALKTLINNKEILLSVMQVFINDPSADWIKMASTKALKIDGDFDLKEILWFPKKKINSCKDKMIGTNPIDILCRELESSSIPNDYKNALIDIIKSDSQSNIYKRSKLSKCGITPHQQIDCLLDIATDEHILGKAYSGLELWV